MDHFKEKELEMLIRFAEVNGVVRLVDFETVFPEDTAAWRAILLGLLKEDYISVTWYSAQNNNPAMQYNLTDKGRLRIVQLNKERSEEETSEHETKEVSGWTKWGAIGAWVAAGLTLIGIIVTIYLAHYPPKTEYIIHDDTLPQLQIDTTAVRTGRSDSSLVVKHKERTDTLNIKNLPALPKEIEKHPDKAILDSLEVLSPDKGQLVQIAYKKGTRNNAYGKELAELLNKNGYTVVTIIEDNSEKRSEKKVYFLRLEQGYILVYINVY